MSSADAFAPFVGADVVVDTTSSYVFIGRLKEVTTLAMTITDVDVHDRAESPSTKERYVMEAKKFGIKTNRKSVTVRLETVLCVSKLEDVIEY
ncbi:MAG: hypothetical protein K8T20_12420 [Planctomycetes bacterium]|nr:hypothetical protein [Planctomycetota bacterium]